MGKKVPNELWMVEAFKGVSPQTSTHFHRKNRGRRDYTPTQKSLDRLERFLTNATIMLNTTGIYIQKWM